ncbi:hypothetical protein [Oerskovia sp. KBS0722]|uniref:hypothetical protein n=1 Tax=Oerskovia sp. KBS0722 TaxID=1179673 RepID=UPI00110DE0FB|nr:hypothetical protein [Oerskovia sp. KBS0722]QDW61296.1 hypothetical protein FFI11_001085 [Oerskovia sp. KBS0722]
MAVVVNVSHRFPRTGSRAEQLAVVRGDWPVPEVDNPEAFADSDDAQELLDAADVLIAAAGNEVVDVQRITGLQVDEGGHVRFETVDEPVLGGMIGQRLRPGAAWEPGESWPVKLADAAGTVSEYLELVGEPGRGDGEPAPADAAEAADAAASGDLSDDLELGGFRLVLGADGNLVVTPPAGRSVTVLAAHEG